MAKKNTNLHSAKREKNDEFYTQLADIEKEMKHYKEFFNGKVVFCNCDDPLESNFTKYFILNFHHLGLKKLICTFYDINGKTAFAFEYDGTDLNNDGIVNEKDIEIIRQSGAYRTILVDDEGFDFAEKEKCWLKGVYGSGDFRSKNVIDYLKESDVVVTNPPFSLFREYVAQLMEYGKKFLIIGPQNAVTYKDIFPHIKNNKLWLGTSLVKEFIQPNGEIKKFGNIRWYTNITHQKRNTPIDLYKEYKEDKYPKYENYNAIEIGYCKDNGDWQADIKYIPKDYNGVMGVPITFLDKYSPTQFEIIGLGIANLGLDCGVQPYKAEHREYRKNIQKRGVVDGDLYMVVNGEVKVPYARILIKKIV